MATHKKALHFITDLVNLITEIEVARETHLYSVPSVPRWHKIAKPKL